MDHTLVLSAVGRHGRCAREEEMLRGTRSIGGGGANGWVGGAVGGGRRPRRRGAISRAVPAWARGTGRDPDPGAPPGFARPLVTFARF